MAPHLIVKKYFVRKQKTNPQYSLRSFARDIGVNPAFVSRILSGKKEIPLPRIHKIAKVLNMDSVVTKELKKSIASLYLKKLGLSLQEVEKSNSPILDFEEKPMTEKEMSVLSPWYNVAVMELATCDDFQNNAQWISSRLSITKQQAEKSLSFLINLGYLSEAENKMEKTHKQIRIPTKQSVGIIRQFHKKMMELAVKEMFENTSETGFGKRLITSTSIAVNMANIPKAKERLVEMQLEISDILREGECTEVFDLTLALFPLTKN